MARIVPGRRLATSAATIRRDDVDVALVMGRIAAELLLDMMDSSRS
jgi:hypothetical protein